MRTSKLDAIPNGWREELAALDKAWQGGDALTPSVLAATLAQWRQRLQRPAHPDEEMLDVVAVDGEPLGMSAPRWFHHLTGLRHRVIHLYLTTPQGLLILQRRAHSKPDWPDMFDTSVGGHVKAGRGWLDGLLAEVEEELGLPANEIETWLAGAVQDVAPPYEHYGVHDGPLPLRNRQVNRLFTAQLSPWGLAALRFADGEVDGVLLVNPAKARALVQAKTGIAPGLRGTFGRWWAWYRQTNEPGGQP